MVVKKIILSFLLILLFSHFSYGVIIEPENIDLIIPGQYIVKLSDNINSQSFVESHSLKRKDGIFTPLKDDVLFVYRYAFNGFAVKLDETQLNALNEMNEVVYIESDVIVTVEDFFEESNNEVTQTNVTWGLARVSTRDQLTGGGSNEFVWDYTYQQPSGSCAVVYVIDTGINTAHEDFGGRAIWGETFIPNSTPEDDNGHGTHCAGTVGGNVYGIAKNVLLVSVKTLGQNGSSVGMGSSTLAGIDWAVNNATSREPWIPAVFSMSLTIAQLNASLEAVSNAVSKGITVVAAAGNANANACNYGPAAAPEAITVGASNILDQRAPFSNYGPCVDIFAPGVNITAPWIGSVNATLTISGTSMATPHVSGLAADYICRFGLKTPAEVDAKLKELATRDAIQNLTELPLETANLLIYYSLGETPNETIATTETTLSTAQNITTTDNVNTTTPDGSTAETTYSSTITISCTAIFSILIRFYSSK